MLQTRSENQGLVTSSRRKLAIIFPRTSEANLRQPFEKVQKQPIRHSLNNFLKTNSQREFDWGTQLSYL